MVLTQIYFMGFFSTGTRIVTELLQSTSSSSSMRVHLRRPNISAATFAEWRSRRSLDGDGDGQPPLSLGLPPPVDNGPQRFHGGQDLSIQASPTTTPLLDAPDDNAAVLAAIVDETADCDHLDAQLTGYHCFQAMDPLVQHQCRRLSTCNTVQPSTTDIEQVFSAIPPGCFKDAIGPRDKGRWVWRCSLLRGPPKFFREARASTHLDARWGRLALGPGQRRPVMTELFAAWSAFTRERGLVSWLFAGSLVGWFFNKDVLPWDDDLDVQVLAAHLRGPNQYLMHNQTVYRGQYFFEINPYSAWRHLDKNNFIDARFIDQRTGAFIDIIAISYFRTIRQLKCKQNEGFIPAHLFPLRRTTFLGAEAWVPHDVPQTLQRKYGPRVLLPQQPQPHHTTHCPSSAPCARYLLDSSTSRWVEQQAS
eukprot:EG_transcript_7792